MPRPLLALSWVCLLCACAPDATGGRRPNIVLFMIDTLRKDHLGSYGYARDTSPVIDSLARKGLLFEDAVAQAPWTLPSLGSLFTSRYPGEVDGSRIDGQMTSLSARFPTLPELLAAAGYRTVSVGTNPYLIPVFELMAGFAEREFHYDAPASEVVDRAIELSASTDPPPDGGAPFFLYLHFMDVHAPNRPPPPFDTMFPTLDSEPHEVRHQRFAFEDVRELDSREFAAYRSHKLALYDGSIRFVDAEIGRVVRHLGERGVLDDTLLVIASDHGEELWDHPALGKRLGLDNKGRYGVDHGHTLFPEQVEVPLILVGPGIPAARVAAQVRNVDLAPTLLSLAGVDLDGLELVGVDLVGAWRDGALRELPAWSETRSRAGHQVSLRSDRHQYLRIGSRELLFDRDASGPELQDRARERPDRLQTLRLEAEGVMAGLAPATGEEVRFGGELVERLRELGYVH